MAYILIMQTYYILLLTESIYTYSIFKLLNTSEKSSGSFDNLSE